MREEKLLEFAAYAAFRNRLLAAAAGGFALSFSGLQVDVIRETPGATTAWPWLMGALAIGLFSAVVEMVNNRLVTHWKTMGPKPDWWARPTHFHPMHRALHLAQVGSLAAMTAAVVVSFIVLTAFGNDVVRAALDAAST